MVGHKYTGKGHRSQTSALTLSCRTTYIYMSYRSANLQMLHFIYYSTNILTEYFKHAAHSLFFSSKCRLFHNAIFFGSCVIHILCTECAKIKKKFRHQRVKQEYHTKCLQVNLQHSRVATMNLTQIIIQHNIDIAFVQELYSSHNNVAGFPKGFKIFAQGGQE